MVGGIAATSQSALADGGKTYRVTIANATHGQPLAPGLIITYRESFSLFELNGVASLGLATMTETGNPGELAGEVIGTHGVATADVLIGQNPPPGPPVAIPGESNSKEIRTGAKYISVVGMLAATNDAVYAVRGIRLPRNGKITVYATAYDAGSELNSEAASDIPALGNDAYSEEDGEGFIHVHNGVHGGGDLVPADHDWRNPVVAITIERFGGDDD